MAEVASGYPVQRRRSERISKSLPLIVRGIDLLGQPFEERTSTLALNLHGCRYVSKHHLPKNSWVTLEVTEEPGRHMRARVAWIQRPHSVREFFQIAVELESPSNIWSVSSPPRDWQETPAPSYRAAGQAHPWESRAVSRSELTTSTEGFGANMTNEYPETASAQPPLEASPAESPLLRQYGAELERQTREITNAAVTRVAERVERAMDDLTRLENDLRENLSAQTVEKQQALVSSVGMEFEKGFERVRELVQELGRTGQALQAEREASLEAASRLTQSRLDLEAANLARAQARDESTPSRFTFSDDDLATWRARLETERTVAQAQWNELLQSSLDHNVGRLVEQLAGRSQELLRSAEQRMMDRVVEFREPLSQISAEAREALSSLRSGLEYELARASSSIAEIEHATTRMREHSAQLETTSHNALDEMHRRLENILQAQTDEMNRRSEDILQGLPQRLSSLVESVSHETAERAIGEIDSNLAPRLEHAAQLASGLASRGAEVDESLRLQRERLRQLSESNFREAAAQTAATISGLRGDFENARKEALAKWNEELEASAVRASHAASEAIGRSSEWFEQEARGRMQVLVEQTMASASGAFQEKAGEAASQFDTRLEEQSAARISQIHEQLNGVAAEIAGRTRSRLDEAAEAAAASFGEVLRRVSEQETENFTTTSRSSLAEREREFGAAASQLLENLEANAQTTLEQFRAQMASQLESSIVEGRNALSRELTSALNAHHAEREARERDWAEGLERLSKEAVARHQDRLQNTGDSWVASSLGRLNEHGQSAIQSLMHSANEAVRESCAKLFQGLSQRLREFPASSGATLGFTAGSEDEGVPSPHGESAAGANA